jgi:hypothetical protein
MGYGRAHRRATNPAPLVNPVQRVDLARLLTLVPNDRRLLVTAAFLGLYLGELYDRCGLTLRIRNYYAYETPDGAEGWSDVALSWCWRISRRLDMALTEIWEIDDGFDPARAVPVVFPGPMPSRRASRRAVVVGSATAPRPVDGAGGGSPLRMVPQPRVGTGGRA